MFVPPRNTNHRIRPIPIWVCLTLWPRVEQRKWILAKNLKKNIITKKTNRQEESPEETNKKQEKNKKTKTKTTTESPKKIDRKNHQKKQIKNKKKTKKKNKSKPACSAVFVFFCVFFFLFFPWFWCSSFFLFALVLFLFCFFYFFVKPYILCVVGLIRLKIGYPKTHGLKPHFPYHKLPFLVVKNHIKFSKIWMPPTTLPRSPFQSPFWLEPPPRRRHVRQLLSGQRAASIGVQALKDLQKGRGIWIIIWGLKGILLGNMSIWDWFGFLGDFLGWSLGEFLADKFAIFHNIA